MGKLGNLAFWLFKLSEKVKLFSNQSLIYEKA
jgi:hypothetical protein